VENDAGDALILAELQGFVRHQKRHNAQESPHFENGLISALFGPHVERMGSPAPHLSWRDLSLDDCGTRTRTSGLVIRDSPHQNANLQLHFGPRKNEGMAEPSAASGLSVKAARRRGKNRDSRTF